MPANEAVLRPPRLYALADLGVLGPERLPAAVETMAGCGIGWIQLRAKGAPGALVVRLAEDCLRRLEGSDARLWINDRADVAALLPLAGLHLGQRDLPPAAARRVVGGGIMIGQSTHGDAELAAADADPAVDVVAVGPVFATTGKASAEPVVGLDFVRRARRATRKPLVAIGGIDARTAAAVLAAGADAVAALGALCRGDLEDNCRRLLAATGGR
ncbi:MAG: thiamine phosphate synthase [Acidobacteria bacterium]|nr:MAG: thiamine phosphate synthase [Acidobacteriota bacterium]